MSEAESNFAADGGAISSPTVTGAGKDKNISNDTLDIFVYIASALLLLLFVEWGLQYREQY
jgi:hypothetical protein